LNNSQIGSSINQIRKRSGSFVDFNKDKISNTVYKELATIPKATRELADQLADCSLTYSIRSSTLDSYHETCSYGKSTESRFLKIWHDRYIFCICVYLSTVWFRILRNFFTINMLKLMRNNLNHSKNHSLTYNHNQTTPSIIENENGLSGQSKTIFNKPSRIMEVLNGT